MSARTLFISGGTRGIGKAIALRFAKNGGQVILAAKTAEPHQTLPGTIYSVAEEIEKVGGRCLPLQVDIRDESRVEVALAEGAAHFGGIDIVVNNASAIDLSPTSAVSMKRYDLMHDINVRGTFSVSKFAIPYLVKSNHPHILTLSPPLNLNPRWFGQHLAYTMSKYGMSMTVLGLAEELKSKGVGVNALWPKTIIETAAIANMPGGEEMLKISRKPEIMADAAFAIISRNPKKCTGNFFIDEEVLRKEGESDFSRYAVDAEQTPMQDLFLD